MIDLSSLGVKIW